MSANGHLKFQGTNRATFVGTTSNIMFDTTSTSLGIGVTGTDHPSSNLYITGNAYVSSNLAIGGVLTMGVVNVAARHNLQAVTDMGNVTTHTVEFTNPTTSLVASGNVSVGKDLTVSSNLIVTGQVTRAYNPGEVIEELNSICDGSTVAVQSGSYTMANITSTLTGTLTHQVITGSTINYTPPPGTKRVYYRFLFHWSALQNSGISHFRMQIDNVAVLPSRCTISGNYSDGSGHNHACFPTSVEYTIDCNTASNDASNGKFTSWTNPKELECTFMNYNHTGGENGLGYRCQLHINEWTDGASSDSIMKPHLTIRAIA